ncbi:MAG: hypothetical protein Q9204_000166 [Flavoplaca sp. TL-2023a]
MENDDGANTPITVTSQEPQEHQHHQDQERELPQKKHVREDPLLSAGTTSSPSPGSTSPKKRRKDRPCVRCVKRNIGHLCHDEPRDHAKTAKAQSGSLDEGDKNAALSKDDLTADGLLSSVDQRRANEQLLQETGLDLGNQPVPTDVQTTSAQLVDPSPTSGASTELPGGGSLPRYSGWSLGEQNHFQDMHSFHPSYMFNAPEVTNEYNLLNDFLSTSLLDDDNMFSTEDAQISYPSSSLGSIIAGGTNGTRGRRPSTQNFRFSGAPQAATAVSSEAGRPPSVMPTDKARETYYMTAADPAGSDTPEERMEKLLKAKYDAGMLRPFNYVKGYARLNQYMDKHMQSTSRQKILRGLDRFRPKFRERMQTLTDMQLVRVEMWFERSLMEYDRVFASMAIPACCWRRTGEIFRGNKEMAELIHVPVEQLRDGKLAIHEIIVEDHLVSYWEKFEGIAFDTTQKAMLTSCSLKNPNLNSSDSEIRCCFSFTIRRDIYDM